jgi:hypothetical protein
VAQKVVVLLTDDMDGKPITDGGGETITFGLDGRNYEIDLSKKNADALRDALAQYVAAARRTGHSGGPRGRSRGSSSASPRPGRDYEPKQVRAWAEKQGIEVSPRGRVPGDLIVKFQAANSS